MKEQILLMRFVQQMLQVATKNSGLSPGQSNNIQCFQFVMHVGTLLAVSPPKRTVL
jgi:hypothetical protein